MRPIDLIRTTAFRWAFACAAIFALGFSLFAGLIYRETAGYLTRRVNAELEANSRSIAHGLQADQLDDVGEYLGSEPEQFKIAGLFDQRGRPLAGNLRSLPPGPLATGRIIEIHLPPELLADTALTPASRNLIRFLRRHPLVKPRVRVLVEPVSGGRTLLIGVGARVVHQVEVILSRALWLTLPPMLMLALAAGWIVSHGALRRIARVHESSRRIMAGELHERLPTRGTHDDFDQLSQIVNSMLDEIERLVLETKGIGEGIAHDLRTPLTRLRARLERGLEGEALDAGISATLAAGMADIDQTLATITALLRIAEVEHGARRAAFAPTDLRRLVTDAIDLYEPIAQEKGLRLRTDLADVPTVIGDADLLFEALANLIDNAIKYSPSGGEVSVALRVTGDGPILRVADSGPGIAVEDWTRVKQRFFRADRSRHAPGSGLGLSLVASIVRLHGFELALDPGHTGCCIDLQCWPVSGQMGAAMARALDDSDIGAKLQLAAPALAPSVQSR